MLFTAGDSGYELQGSMRTVERRGLEACRQATEKRWADDVRELTEHQLNPQTVCGLRSSVHIEE